MHRFLSFAAVLLLVGCFDVAAEQAPKGDTRGTGVSTKPRLATGASATRGGPKLLPGTPANVLSTIQGEALDSVNGRMPDTVIRLRDARLGRIVEATKTDKAGGWTFENIDPGSYVVELMGSDSTVLAATSIISVNAGDAVMATVKLPFRVPPMGGLLGQTVPSAVATSAAAAASGVLAATATGEPVSPPQ